MRTVARFVGRRISDRVCGGIGSCSAGVLGLLAAFTLTLLAACGGDKPTEPDPVDPREPEPPTVAAVEVSPKTAALSALGAEQAFTATAKDASGEEIEDVVVQWHSSDPSVAVLDAEGTATAKAAGESTITATIDGVQAHAELTVTQTAAAVRFRSSPEDGVAGRALNPALQVEILDEDGSVVSGATDAVTITLGSAPSGAELTGSRTANAVNGIASFSGLSIERAAKDYTLVARAGGIDPDTSSTFEIAPGPAAVLALDGEPDDAVAGDTLSALEVRVEDAYGNGVDAELELEVTIGSGPSGAVLDGTTTLETEAGEAAFDDLVIERAGEGYTLRVSAADVERAETESFAISAGAAAQLIFESAPEEAEGLEPFDVRVAVEDEYGNAVRDAAVWIDLDFGEAARSDVELVGTARVRAHNGKAAFETAVDRPAPGFTLKASSDGLDTAESEPFDVGLEIAQITTGTDIACAVTTAKHAYCWGDPASQNGQLGDGKGEGTSLPVPVSGGHAFETIVTGYSHTCALTDSGRAYCWGYNGYGQLGAGDASPTRTLAPVAVEGGHQFRDIAVYQDHTCALDVSGDVYCWGQNGAGQLGNGDAGTDQSRPVKVSGSHHFVALAAGTNHTCAVTDDGDAYCWGSGSVGRLGNGGTNDSDIPVLVRGDHDFVDVVAGGSYSCGLTDEGEAYCWGANGRGQLGNGDAGNNQDEPSEVTGDHIFASISARLNSTCALTESGEAYCWGQNNQGQLGDDSQDDHDEPTQVDGGHTFASISVGTRFTCALTQDRELYCWGQNSSSQYGNGTTDSSHTPVRVEF